MLEVFLVDFRCKSRYQLKIVPFHTDIGLQVELDLNFQVILNCPVSKFRSRRWV